ncbi:MAG: transketolase [Clostridia bacterium]
MMQTTSELQETARTLRRHVVNMIGGKDGKTGHLGGSCSIAEIVSALYFRQMKFDPHDVKNPERDRLIFSKGHAAIIQYAALAELGVFPVAELQKVKTCGAMLQGHPDMTKTPGIEANTGSLGQGLSIGCGLAASLQLSKNLAHVYVIMGDGEIAEGQIWEAAMWAAFRKLNHLIGILDCNHVQATGTIKERMDSGDLKTKFEAFGWRVMEIDGHCMQQVVDTLARAAEPQDGPVLILANTVKGKYVSFAENESAFHNNGLTPEQYQQALQDIAQYQAY